MCWNEEQKCPVSSLDQLRSNIIFFFNEIYIIIIIQFQNTNSSSCSSPSKFSRLFALFFIWVLGFFCVLFLGGFFMDFFFLLLSPYSRFNFKPQKNWRLDISICPWLSFHGHLAFSMETNLTVKKYLSEKNMSVSSVWRWVHESAEKKGKKSASFIKILNSVGYLVLPLDNWPWFPGRCLLFLFH